MKSKQTAIAVAEPPLTKIQFRRRLRALELSQRRFSFMLKMDVSTVNRWATGKQPPPHWVRLLLDLMVERVNWRQNRPSERRTKRVENFSNLPTRHFSNL